MNALDCILDLVLRAAMRRAFDLLPEHVRLSFSAEPVFEGARLVYSHAMRHRYHEEGDRIEQMIDALRVCGLRAETDETQHRIVVSRLTREEMWSPAIWRARILSALRRKFRSSYSRDDFDRAGIKVTSSGEDVVIEAALPELADRAAVFACEHVSKYARGHATHEKAVYVAAKVYRAKVRVLGPVAKVETVEPANDRAA